MRWDHLRDYEASLVSAICAGSGRAMSTSVEDWGSGQRLTGSLAGLEHVKDSRLTCSASICARFSCRNLRRSSFRCCFSLISSLSTLDRRSS